jgi:hypothetical protein
MTTSTNVIVAVSRTVQKHGSPRIGLVLVIGALSPEIIQALHISLHFPYSIQHVSGVSPALFQNPSQPDDADAVVAKVGRNEDLFLGSIPTKRMRL